MLHVATLEACLLGANCHVEHAGLDATCLSRAVVDLVEDAVEEAGNGGENGGCEFLQVLGQLQNISTEKSNCSSGME